MPLIIATPFRPLPPSWLEQEKLSASDAASSSQFGYSVSVAADGNTAVIGARWDNGVHFEGAAYIFIRSGGTWTEIQKLTASDAANSDAFGSAVAISHDGNTIIVGATQEFRSSPNPGAAYVFTKSGGSPLWQQQQKLTASDATDDDFFGHAVALSADGTTAIVGAPREDGVGTDYGAAYVFVGTGSPISYSEQDKLDYSSPANSDRFGWSVDLSNDGDTAIIGIERNGGFTMADGAAAVFTRSGSTWTEGQTLTASDEGVGGDANGFGWSAAIDSDADTIVIGAYLDDATGLFRGAAYVFTKSGGSPLWTEQSKLVPPSLANEDEFGRSVDISGDGDTVIVGSMRDDIPPNDAGSISTFTRSGSSWSFGQLLTASDKDVGDRFGISVSIASTDNTLIGGARNETSQQGAAYVFTLA